MALKYFEHFMWIASAMDNLSFTGIKLWDHDDGIYYDVLRFPDGNGVRLKVRSLVGLLPLAATTVLPVDLRERLPRFFEEAQWFLERHPYTAATVTVPLEVGAGGSRILSLVNSDKLARRRRDLCGGGTSCAKPRPGSTAKDRRLLLGEINVHQRQGDGVEGQVPDCVPGVLPLVRHGDDVRVVHVEPVLVAD